MKKKLWKLSALLLSGIILFTSINLPALAADNPKEETGIYDTGSGEITEISQDGTGEDSEMGREGQDETESFGTEDPETENSEIKEVETEASEAEDSEGDFETEDSEENSETEDSVSEEELLEEVSEDDASILLDEECIFDDGQTDSVIPAKLSVETSGKKQLECASGYANLMSDSYSKQRWSSPVKSYIYDNGDGTFTILDASAGKVNIDIYDKKDLKRKSTASVTMELSKFGGFYRGQKYNYIVFGKNNTEQNDSAEVLRLVRYDMNFKKVDSLSVKNCYTAYPFEAGSLRMSEYGNELVVHTARKRYDGHQSQLTLVVDTANMKVTNGLGEFQTNHVSHSFNQFVLHDGENHVMVDHGDAYPRSIVLQKYNDKTYYGYDEINLFEIPGPTGANCTGVTVGGFEMSAGNYIVVANTIDHSKAKGYDSFHIDITLDERDVAIYTCPRNFTENDTPQKVLLTSYVGKKKLASTPYLVKLSETEFVVLWEEYDYVQNEGNSYYTVEDKGVRAVEIDENGNKLSDIVSFKNLILSADCQPILMDGVIAWYTNNGEGIRHLQMISCNSFKFSQNIIVTKLEKEYYIGDEGVRLEVTPDSSSGLTDFEFRTSNEEVALVGADGLISFVGVGSADITVYQAGNEEYAPFTYTQTIKVKHRPVTEILLSENDVEKKAGDVFSLTATVLPEEATFKELSWISSNPYVADVDAMGRVICHSPGKAVIKATASYDKVWASCTVTVVNGTVHVTEIGIAPGAVSIKPGETAELSVKISPEDATDQAVSWVSSNPKVADVDESGVVTGISTGYASVSVTSKDGGISAACNVTVYQESSFFVEAVEDQFYTGKAIKPEVKVWDGSTLLVKGKDYKISYKNNTNVSNDPNKLPVITISGNGNYTDKQFVTFNILPQNIANPEFTADNITTEYSGRVQKKKPVLKWGNKTLKEGKDYTLNYKEIQFEGENAPVSFLSAGYHEIEIVGKGNYTGARCVNEIITEKGFSIAKANVAAIKAITYTGEAITLNEEQLKVTMGSGKNKKELKNGKDYRVAYDHNLEVGKATITLTGIGNYSGMKKVTFDIKSIPFKKATVTGLEDCFYNGNAQEPKNVKVSLDGQEIRKDKDYTVELSPHTNAGTVKVTLKGMGGYKFTIKKSYKILPYDLEKDGDGKISGLAEEITASYLCGGSRPEPVISFDGTKLIKGADYTLSYQNNNAVTTEITKKPVVKIKGKGNFKGTYTKEFTINAKALNDVDEPVSMRVNNIPFANKKGNYICKPILTDVNGKKLAAGKDYDKNIIYTLEDGTVLTKNDQVEANTRIRVTVNGTGNYNGKLEASYYVTPDSIAKAKVTRLERTYTGGEITLEEEDMEVWLDGKKLDPAKDYRIVKESYVNNIKKGTAKVTIEGQGDYGGTKVVSYTIKAKLIKWLF